MNILVVGAHPDDIAISCSGTISKYIDNGENVYLCTISNGCYGHTEIEPERLAGIRIVEDKAMADFKTALEKEVELSKEEKKKGETPAPKTEETTTS